MVALDHGLVALARTLTTDANVQHLNELIFVYEQAVALHNNGTAKHAVYRQQHENELRQFAERETGRRALTKRARSHAHQQLAELNGVVKRKAFEAMEKFASAEKHCQELAERVSAALLFCNAKKEGPKEVA